jgi:dihydrofolate reductase
MIKAILACDGQGGISRNGVMPWPHNKADLKHFQSLTKNHIVVMGRKTWEAPDMPSPLPNRTNIVVTRNTDFQTNGADVICDNVIEQLTSLAKNSTVVVIGGAVLFEQLIDIIDVLHLSRITGHYECDTFLPMANISSQFDIIDRVVIDNMTQFETHIARRLHDLPIRAEL